MEKCTYLETKLRTQGILVSQLITTETLTRKGSEPISFWDHTLDGKGVQLHYLKRDGELSKDDYTRLSKLPK